MHRLFSVALLLLVTGCNAVPSISLPDDDQYDYLPDASDIANEVQAIGKNNGTPLFTYAGLVLCVVGVVLFATVAKDTGAKLLAGGAVISAYPYIVQSHYFTYIIAGTLIISAGFGLWHLWWYIRKDQIDG